MIVEMADVAGCQPTVLQHPRRLVGIAPVAVHHILAADHDFAVVRDAHFAALYWRSHGFETDSGARPVAGDDGCRLGLAVALEEGDPDRFEEHADFRIE